MPPLTDSDMGPMLTAAGLTGVPGTGYGPESLWKGTLNGTEYTQSQRAWANQYWPTTSPYATAAVDQTPWKGADGMLYTTDPTTGNAKYVEGQPYPNPTVTASPDEKFDAAGNAFQWNGRAWVATPEFNNPTKAAGYRAPAQYAPPAPTHDVFTDVNGDRVYITNGQETSRIPGADFAAMSPQQKLVADQQAAEKADAAAMARVQAQETGANARNATSEAGATARQAAGDVAATQRTQLTGENQARLQAMGDTEANRRALLNEQQANARAGLSAQVQGFQSVNQLAPQLGDLALRNAEFTSKTTSTPQDYLARAFFTRGQTSPLPQVSQADIINQLTKNIADYQGALSGFNQNFGGFNAQLPNVPSVSPAGGFVPPTAATAPAAAAAGATATPAVNPFAGFNSVAQTQGPANYLGINATGAAPANSSAGVPMATGGFTRAPVARVGDSPDGTPNATEETLLNPMHAPIGIVPNPATGAAGGEKPDPGHAAIIKAIGFVSDPKTQHALVDELAKFKSKNVPRFATGTGAMGFSAPVLPTQAPTTQAALQALEASVRPPALNAILSGGTPADLQLGFTLPSRMGYNSLTTDERSALATPLATQYNLAPSDVETAISQRYSTGNRGTASTKGF